jgi:hypothetical protein
VSRSPEPLPVAQPAQPGEVDTFVATWGQTIGGWVRGAAIIVLVVYMLVAWAEGTQATGPVDRELFLASTPVEYLAPGVLYLFAPLLLLLAGPWAMGLRKTRLTRSGREALRTFRFERRKLSGGRTLLRRERYGLRVAFQVALWLLGLVLLVGVILAFLQDRPTDTWNIGGYVAVGLTAAGLVSALLMIPRRDVLQVRVDADGHVRQVGDGRPAARPPAG